jgi:hypothetical protein
LHTQTQWRSQQATAFTAEITANNQKRPIRRCRRFTQIRKSEETADEEEDDEEEARQVHPSSLFLVLAVQESFCKFVYPDPVGLGRSGGSPGGATGGAA